MFRFDEINKLYPKILNDVLVDIEEAIQFQRIIEAKMVNLGGGKWQCVDCMYESQSCNVKKHIESKHMIPQEYSCRFCGKILRGKHAYNNHVYTVHKS